MMRRLLIAPFAGLLLLASCEHSPDSNFLDQIQQAVASKCGYLPTIKAILSLLNSHPGWTSATDIATRICAVVPQQPGPRIAPQPPPVLDNVPVPGWFVR